MEFSDYLDQASQTAIYPKRIQDTGLGGMIYCALKLAGETGEFTEHVGKAIRDDNGNITDKRRNQMIGELGDILWYWTMLCQELNVPPNYVAAYNLAKLMQRKKENKLHGEGSDR